MKETYLLNPLSDIYESSKCFVESRSGWALAEKCFIILGNGREIMQLYEIGYDYSFLGHICFNDIYQNSIHIYPHHVEENELEDAWKLRYW